MAAISTKLANALKGLDLRIDTEYQGRFMFGRTCFGIVVDDFNDLVEIALDLRSDVQKEFRRVLRNMRKDNMGLGYIAYFPAYQWPENEQ